MLQNHLWNTPTRLWSSPKRRWSNQKQLRDARKRLTDGAEWLWCHALRDGVDLRPRGKHVHDAHAPAERGENQEQSEEAEGHSQINWIRLDSCPLVLLFSAGLGSKFQYPVTDSPVER